VCDHLHFQDVAGGVFVSGQFELNCCHFYLCSFAQAMQMGLPFPAPAPVDAGCIWRYRFELL
jgi:hypothetical protein